MVSTSAVTPHNQVLQAFMPMIDIRPEQDSDQRTIYEITERAFRDMPFSDGDEHDLIDRLRDQGQLSLSLVAQDGDLIVGQITFSPATVSGGTGPWYALGPVSVNPNRQGEGIGSLLIEEGLREIKKRGALGCILTGNPLYYRRFGFEHSSANCPTNEQDEYFMVKLLAEVKPVGNFAFHSTFYGEA